MTLDLDRFIATTPPLKRPLTLSYRTHIKNLTLRSPRSGRLEGSATGAVCVADPSRRRRAPPQGEVMVYAMSV